MKFDLQNDDNINIIHTFDDSHFLIGERRFTNSVIVTSDFVDHWSIDSLDKLQEADFEQLLDHQPEIVILGTGPRLAFPKMLLTRSLINAQIGVETMDTPAACRTYNVLAGDGRRVAALLFLA